MGFYEEDLRNELPFSSYPQYTMSTCIIAIDTDLNHLAEIVFVKFLHCKVIFFSLSILSGRKSLYSAHIRSRDLYSPLRVEYAHKLF